MKLDIVLRYLNKVYDEGMKSKQYDNIWKTKGEILIACYSPENEFYDKIVALALSDELPHQINLIMEYLSDTDLLIQKKYDSVLGTDKYSILWKGKIFIENGGYITNAKSEYDENQRKIRNDLWLVRGSWFAGFVATCLLLFEVYKFLIDHQLVFVCH